MFSSLAGMTVAIGLCGVLIITSRVRGEIARKHGYVPLARFQKPAATWQNTTEDVRFRKLLGPPQYAIDVPGVYRIRHSKRGYVDVGCEL